MNVPGSTVCDKAGVLAPPISKLLPVARETHEGLPYRAESVTSSR